MTPHVGISPFYVYDSRCGVNGQEKTTIASPGVAVASARWDHLVDGCFVEMCVLGFRLS